MNHGPHSDGRPGRVGRARAQHPARGGG